MTNHRAAYLTISILLYFIYSLLYAMLQRLGALKDISIVDSIVVRYAPLLVVLIWWVFDWHDDAGSR